ncbi:peptidase C14, caspase domain-containing protein [Mycena galopus ATCC 62051]|nr:peptidase C14, caspase domain-containing protein [Mycena galopus ATCC 62051]
MRPHKENSDQQAISEKRSAFGKHFWAVVVGINDYKHLPPAHHLRGCVNDARLIVGYLTGGLGVPEDHILLLSSESETDKLPTRARILSALYEHLRDNPLIQKGDNLLFHFSGHGSSYERELGRLRTEALCPCDRTPGDQHSTDFVPDISDRELNIILSEICRKKGPNLTVILDCCFSGGATRDASGGGIGGASSSGIGGTIGSGTSTVAAIRAAPPVVPYDSDVAQEAIVADIVHGRPDRRETLAVRLMFLGARDDPRRMSESQSPLAPDWKSDISTHVLLAACKPAETAKELRSSNVGVFTSALISALTSPRGNDPAMTYTRLFGEVIQRPDRQTPMVVGKRKDSRLWFEEGNIPEPSYNIRGMSSK